MLDGGRFFRRYAPQNDREGALLGMTGVRRLRMTGREVGLTTKGTKNTKGRRATPPYVLAHVTLSAAKGLSPVCQHEILRRYAPQNDREGALLRMTGKGRSAE